MKNKIGKFELLKKIGKGGMGVVYLARDTETEREVALKVLPPELTRNPKYVERFRREAKAVSGIDHPNIIKVHEVGEEEGVHYFAMEYLGGPNLRQLLKQRGRMPVPEALQIIVQISEALDLAHSRGIIHRDVKPDNIMSDDSGTFKIMDFGIAYTEEGTRLTVTGTIMGTPEYMSPEQASGSGVDRRTDIYSLGIVLYEMLTGKVPFHAQTAIEVLQMHMTRIPESPKLINPEIPGNLAGVIAKMIEKQAVNRYDSFRHVINAISQAVPEEMRTVVGAVAREVRYRPGPQEERAAPRVRERVILKTPAVVSIAFASSIILNVALFALLMIRMNRAPQAPQPMRPTFTIGGQAFAPPTISGGTLYLAAEDGTLYAYDVGGGDVKWTFSAGDKITAAPLVDGDRVYVGSWDQNIYALDASNEGRMIWKAFTGGVIFATPVLSDGTLYVCTREGKVLAIDADRGTEKWKDDSGGSARLTPTLENGTLIVPLDDRRLLAYSAIDGKRIGEIPTGRIKTPVVAVGQELYFAAFDDMSGTDGLCVAGIPEWLDDKARLNGPQIKVVLGSERNSP